MGVLWPWQGQPAPGCSWSHCPSTVPEQWWGISCIQGLCTPLEGLELISFADSTLVCQILEMLLCCQDLFAGDTRSRGAGVLTHAHSKMGAPWCVWWEPLLPCPSLSLTPAPCRKCQGVRNKCGFVWFSGFETAPGNVARRQT